MELLIDDAVDPDNAPAVIVRVPETEESKTLFVPPVDVTEGKVLVIVPVVKDNACPLAYIEPSINCRLPKLLPVIPESVDVPDMPMFIPLIVSLDANVIAYPPEFIRLGLEPPVKGRALL